MHALRPFHRSLAAQAAERELASREAAFEDRHLAITLWSWGQLSHVPAELALAPALEGLQRRLPGMDPHSLVTLVDGMGRMQAARRRRQAAAAAAALPGADGEVAGEQTAAEAWEGRRLAAVAAAAGAPAAGAAADALVPAAVLDALVDRVCQLLPRLQQFELALLLRGFAELGSGAAADRLLRAPAPAGEALLAGTAQRGRLPWLVELLWAMAAWRYYPAAAFQTLARRLGGVPREFRFCQPTLALLGEALAAMEPRQRQQLRLRRGLVMAAAAAARAVAAEAVLGPAGAAGSSGASGGSEGSDGDALQEQRSPARRQRQPAAAKGAQPPVCSNANDELPMGSSLDEGLARGEHDEHPAHP